MLHFNVCVELAGFVSIEINNIVEIIHADFWELQRSRNLTEHVRSCTFAGVIVFSAFHGFLLVNLDLFIPKAKK